MKVKVGKIGETPLVQEESLDISSWGLDTFDVKFSKTAPVKYEYLKAGEEILVSAEFVFRREIVCSRCLDKAVQSTKRLFRKSYGLNELSEYLDCSEDVREEILLNFPMKVLCSPGCRGICAGCGVNLNHDSCRCNETKPARGTKKDTVSFG